MAAANETSNQQTRRVLVTGAAGRLGSRVVETLTARGYTVQGVDVGDFDISDFAATRAYIADWKPDLVLHCAAWTDVDGCARDPERAVVVNGFGAQHAAIAAQEVGAAVLYVSTNEVFDGRRQGMYYEYDTPNPANPYAYSKYVGEQAIARHNPRHYIVRTAWLFAHGGRNFLQTILNAAAAGKSLRVVVDEVANPTYNDDLAQAIAALLESGRCGTYHLVNEGAVSRWEFARYVLDCAGHAETPIERIMRAQWQRPSVPPPYTPLANLAGRHLGITLRSWRDAVRAFLAKEGLLK